MGSRVSVSLKLPIACVLAQGAHTAPRARPLLVVRATADHHPR